MSLTQEKIYPPHPTPKRGVGFFMGFNQKVNRIAYNVDNLIYQRGLTNIFDCEVYNQHAAKTTQASYSPNGRWIASADEEGHLRVWTPQNKDKTLAVEARPISGPVLDMAWTEDSQRLAIVGQGQKSYGCVINAETGASLGEVVGHTGAVNTCALRVQRPFRWVTAGDDCQHVFYKGPPFKFDHTGHDHDKFIEAVRYAPDGSIYATVGLDGRVCTYDGQTGAYINTFQQPCGISSLAFSPNSKQILLALMNGSAVIIDAEKGETVETYKIGDEVYQQQMGAFWTADKKMTVSLNGDFNFLDNGAITIERGHTAALDTVCPIPGGFATGGADGRVLLWKYDNVPYAVFSPDTTCAPISGLALLPGNEHIVVARADGVGFILNISDASVVKQLTLGKKASGFIVVGKDYACTYVEKNLIFIRNETATPQTLNFVPTAIAVSPDGEEIAVGGADKLVHLFKPDGTETGTISGCFSECAAICYSPDGSKISATSNNKEIIVWNRSDLANPVHDGWRFHSLAVTKLLWLDEVNLVTVSKDRSIRVWSLQKKRKYVVLERAHEQGIADAIWTEDKLLLTAGRDGAVKTWKVEPAA